MALGANERQRSAVPLQDPDGRLIVVGPDGVPISGGTGGGGADPLSDGSDAGALPTKTLWVAGADGTVLRGLRVDASGRARVVVEGTPAVSVSNFPGSQAVTGPLTDAQLRASNVPVSGPVTDTQLRASAVPVSGPLTDTQLRASAVPVSDSRLPAALVGGRLDVNIGAAPQVAVNNVETLADNAGFTDGTSKLFPQGYIFDEVAGTALTENDIAAARVNANRAVATVTEDGVTRGRYATVKAASTAAAAADPAQVVSLSPNSPVTPPGLTKSAQGATGFSTQDLKDAGRNILTFATANVGAAATTTDTLLSLTGYKSGAAVAATTTPAVVTAGKIYRIISIQLGMMALASITAILFKLRANTGGLVAITSPAVASWFVGTTVATAGALTILNVDIPGGLEFAAGTGIGISYIGLGTTGNAAASGLPVVQITGYEY